jgi:hypothetical protein
MTKDEWYAQLFERNKKNPQELFCKKEFTQDGILNPLKKINAEKKFRAKRLP